MSGLEAMSGLDGGTIRGLSNAKLEALVEMMLLAASADGELSPVEREHFVNSVESLTDSRLGKADLEAVLDRAKTQLDASGREARLAAVKERLPDSGARKVALSLAIQVTAADGIIRTSERDFLLETAEALEIDSQEAADLVRRLSPR